MKKSTKGKDGLFADNAQEYLKKVRESRQKVEKAANPEPVKVQSVKVAEPVKVEHIKMESVKPMEPAREHFCIKFCCDKHEHPENYKFTRSGQDY